MQRIKSHGHFLARGRTVHVRIAPNESDYRQAIVTLVWTPEVIDAVVFLDALRDDDLPPRFGWRTCGLNPSAVAAANWIVHGTDEGQRLWPGELQRVPAGHAIGVPAEAVVPPIEEDLEEIGCESP